MVGVVTLTPSKSNETSGTMAVTLVETDGPVVNLGFGGITLDGHSGPGTYSLSGTTLVITPAGQPAQSYTAYSGLVSSAGVIQDVFALRLDSSGCSDQLIVRSK